MSSVGGVVDISEQPPILEENEDNEDAGQLVDNEDAGQQSMSVKLDLLMKIVKICTR